MFEQLSISLDFFSHRNDSPLQLNCLSLWVKATPKALSNALGACRLGPVTLVLALSTGSTSPAGAATSSLPSFTSQTWNRKLGVHLGAVITPN
jgi:hypothetical protein